MENKSIESLINENFVYAKVLDFFGVEFYESRNKTLKEVCAEHNLSSEQLSAVLENSRSERAMDFLALRKCPVALVIAYLKHSHQVFIKDALPFLLKTVNRLNGGTTSVLKEDLKMILPMFVEDFIKHIYEEEDKFFAYILDLDSYLTEPNSRNPLLDRDDFSIQEFALHHHDSDDEMAGIRGITNSYSLVDLQDVQLKVILQELKAFDDKLQVHARIENDILFPKAMELEKRAKALFRTKVIQN
ncbi:iron-sulfur cluster repair di-iron protein [Reichenbachiella agariperforans]|uniref:iron-sulfur cluster repair di-iron protein n=1 Tax=Reichenbachiella agariperforans TaxID=156994 RepID=UPI001C0A004B|nr:iron-sulfur cluster repair di-iron protein [Reichenbachiella agariperforans]MBU2915554.1 iron-sulfur cluster repair di-iron protein [Reichenbachiella agariperforans]